MSTTTTSTTATKVAANQGPALIAVGATLLAFNVFFIGLRCYTSTRIAKRFNFNDLFMVAAVVNPYWLHPKAAQYS
jgi:hypothetical protein